MAAGAGPETGARGHCSLPAAPQTENLLPKVTGAVTQCNGSHPALKRKQVLTFSSNLEYLSRSDKNSSLGGILILASLAAWSADTRSAPQSPRGPRPHALSQPGPAPRLRTRGWPVGRGGTRTTEPRVGAFLRGHWAVPTGGVHRCHPGPLARHRAAPLAGLPSPGGCGACEEGRGGHLGGQRLREQRPRAEAPPLPTHTCYLLFLLFPGGLLFLPPPLLLDLGDRAQPPDWVRPGTALGGRWDKPGPCPARGEARPTRCVGTSPPVRTGSSGTSDPVSARRVHAGRPSAQLEGEPARDGGPGADGQEDRGRRGGGAECLWDQVRSLG